MNLVYLGVITGQCQDTIMYSARSLISISAERIPVMPMFTPSHIGGHVPPIAFGDVFDMARLRAGLGKPVLEWRDVKDPKSDAVDDLGCWNVWEAVQYHEAFPRASAVTRHLSLGL